MPKDFFKEKTICNYLVTTKLKQIWAIELDLFREFVRVCKKYNLRWFAIGGTVLGCARHGGFIPWDDDMDVAMPRTDYNKLKTLSVEFRHPYFLQTSETDAEYGYSFMKLRNSNTTWYSEKFIHKNFNQGIFFDIFPLDKTYPEVYVNQRKEIGELIKISSASMKYGSTSLNEKDNEQIKRYYNSEKSCKSVFLDIEKVASRYETEDTPCLSWLVFLGYPDNKSLWSKEIFDDYVIMPFMGMPMRMPIKWEKYLSINYGDWRRFPPVEERGKWHSRGDNCNPLKPYKLAIKETQRERVANAIILAAGKSQRFAPFTYEKPKGLFKVRGEILINRQIEQLIEAGINEIYVVVGFMKEKFFYLEQKYPQVKLIVNNTFASYKGNLYSLYVAREHLGNTFICCADQYFVTNPFLEKSEHSYRACVWKKGKFREFGVQVSDADAITRTDIGGSDSYAMVGHAYFTETFSNVIRDAMEKEINDFGIANMFWEEFYNKHRKQLTLFAKYYNDENIQEFESVDDLRHFDEDFLNNIDSDIVVNICKTINCQPNDIDDIEVIQKGLTNVSFKFSVHNVEYVYRHPGGTAGNLVDRKTELYAQYKAKEIGLDNSVIYMDAAGWKLSYYVKDLISTDIDNDEVQLAKAMEYLHKLHTAKWNDSCKMFDTFKEGLKLMTIASATKGNLLAEFAELTEKARTIDKYMKDDGMRKLALCHNDVYAPNYLVTRQGDMYLIDWEYAGVNDKANDVACICCRYDMTDEQIEKYLKAYVGRTLSVEEHRHYMAAIAVCSFYWFCWGLYKGSVNDDDGFFFLPAYHNCIRFMDKAINSYNEK